MVDNVTDWVYSGNMDVNVFCCPRCMEHTYTRDVVPKYCTNCGLKFSNGGLELEE